MTVTISARPPIETAIATPMRPPSSLVSPFTTGSAVADRVCTGASASAVIVGSGVATGAEFSRGEPAHWSPHTGAAGIPGREFAVSTGWYSKV